MTEFRKAIESAINCSSKENGSDTPDFILAEYLIDCLAAFDKAVRTRDQWYGHEPWAINSVLPITNTPTGEATNVESYGVTSRSTILSEEKP